jgi:hypothetical protein
VQDGRSANRRIADGAADDGDCAGAVEGSDAHRPIQRAGDCHLGDVAGSDGDVGGRCRGLGEVVFNRERDGGAGGKYVVQDVTGRCGDAMNSVADILRVPVVHIIAGSADPSDFVVNIVFD